MGRLRNVNARQRLNGNSQPATSGTMKTEHNQSLSLAAAVKSLAISLCALRKWKRRLSPPTAR
ncbi:hypothetical protein SBV1_180035 [Verrucomicrobia bacterium]|nr:hypothetical protein SBV1_180035 [Verrucomicrobiota bacterium]